MKKRSFFILLIFQLLGVTSCIDDIFTDEDERAAFLGTWLVSESCVRFNYEVEIKADVDSDTKVFLYNFALAGLEYPPAYGFVKGNVVEIPSQTIGDDWTVKGSGYLKSAGRIVWNYEIVIAGDESDCQADYDKP